MHAIRSISRLLFTFLVIFGIFRINSLNKTAVDHENTHHMLCSLQDDCDDLSCEIMCLLNESRSTSHSNTAAHLLESLKSRTRVLNTSDTSDFDFKVLDFAININHFDRYSFSSYLVEEEPTEKPPEVNLAA